MATVRNVPHQEGRHYTFGVKRHFLGFRPGWKVVRVAGSFWQLPPNVLKHYSVEQIQRFHTLADWQQKDSFNSIKCNEIGKSRNATERGVYWTGQNAFQTGGFAGPTEVREVEGMLDGKKYVGLHIHCPDSPQYDYLLVTDRDVTFSTFYKYLLFYSRNIYFHPFNRDRPWDIGFPYLRLRSKEACSIENFNSIPTLCKEAS